VWRIVCSLHPIYSIAIPDSVTTIGEYAFADSTKLESVLFTDQSCLVEIGEAAFAHRRPLQSIVIPNSVIEIGECAFKLQVTNSSGYKVIVTEQAPMEEHMDNENV
jgi:hypothetical protein